MKARRLVMGTVLAALVCGAAWYGWQWYTAPTPPIVPLEGVNKERVQKIEEALAKVRRAPRAGEAWGELGMVLLANGFFEQSIPCFVHAQRFDPAEPRWPYFHAYAAANCANPREALVRSRQALALAQTAEERGPILLPLALALIEDGQLAEAEQYLSELRDIEGDSPAVDLGLGVLALSRDDRAAARRRLSKLADHPSARKRACSLLAGLVEGNGELAQYYRRQATELPDDQPWPGSFDGELAQYRAAPIHHLGNYYELSAQNRTAEAMETLRKLAAESPNEMVCYGLGYNLFMLKQWDEAAKALRQAIGFNPKNTKAHLFLGVCLYQMGEKRYEDPDGKEQALELFRQAVLAEDKALSLQKELPHAHLVRGKALKHLGRTKESLEALREAVLVASDSAEMHVALGEGLAEAGQLKEALEHLENAVQLARPDDPRPRAALEKWRAKSKTTN